MTLRRSLLSLVLLLAPAPLLAQAPPSHPGAMAMAPLPAPELPDGTVTVRVARRSLATPAVGVEVVATVAVGQGKPTQRKTKTDDEGRATFEKIAAQAQFQASVIVDGETLSTAQFPMPDKGGVRFLLVAGEEAAADPHAGMAAADPSAGMAGDPHAGMANAAAAAIPGVRGGQVAVKEGTPPGRLVLRVLDRAGQPIPGQLVRLGKSNLANKGVEFLPATTDASGVATWEKLAPGKDYLYAAILEREGLRVGTDAFSVGDAAGLAGELRMPGRTNDPRVLRVAASTRMMIEPREDSLSILQNLVIENTSPQVFEPDAKGLFLPLPAGFSNAEKLPGGVDLDLLDGQGAIMRVAVPPTTSPSLVAQARMGFVLDSKDRGTMEIVQPMPLGMAGGLVMLPGQFPLTLSAPGLREKPTERDDSGITLRIFELDAVPPGAALRLTIGGLPTRPTFGKWIAGGICLVLIVAGILGARRGRRIAPAAKA